MRLEQALERYKRDYENRNESSLPPVDFSASATPRVEPSASHTEDLIQRMSATPGPQPDNGSDNERQLSPMSPLTDGTLWNASTGDEESRREEARRVAETELEEARRQSQVWCTRMHVGFGGLAFSKVLVCFCDQAS